MRYLASTLLLISVVLQLLLGGLYVMSSRYEPVARAGAGASPPPSLATEATHSPGRQLALGLVVLGGGLCGLIGALLARRRRPPSWLTVALASTATASLLVVIVADGAITVALIGLCLALLALGSLLLGRRGQGTGSQAHG